MTYDPQRHHRQSIRLKGYDYRHAGAYLVTICTQDRACLLGEVVDHVMRPSDAGRMVETVWRELPIFYPGVDIDAFVVMPNHVHGIILLVGAGTGACPDAYSDGHRDPAHQPGRESVGAAPRGRPRSGQAQGPAPTGFSLGDVVHRFKTMTTKRYADGVKHLEWPPFRGRLWQRNYHEHIVRDEPELDRIRRYIDENPLRWDQDGENPRRGPAPQRRGQRRIAPGRGGQYDALPCDARR